MTGTVRHIDYFPIRTKIECLQGWIGGLPPENTVSFTRMSKRSKNLTFSESVLYYLCHLPICSYCRTGDAARMRRNAAAKTENRMPRNFFFQMIDGHLVNAKPENESDIPDTEKKPRLSYRKQDLIAFIRNRIDKTFQFDGTCRGMAQLIAYDRNKKLAADTPQESLIKPDTAAAEKQLGHFLATGCMERRCFTYLKNVLYVTDKDIADDHREQARKRKPDRAEARDLNYFSHHIPFLMKHRDRIISRKEYYNVKSDRFGCSFAYTGRSAPVTLGE